MYLQGAQDRVQAASFPSADEIHPCTEQEVEALEAKLGNALPAAFREFLLWCGKGLGEIWRGARCLEYEELLDQFGLEGAREKLAETGSNPSVLDRAIVFQFDEDGQFSFVRLDEGDDPPVYGLNEGEPLTRHCDHFSDYVRLIVDQEFGTSADEEDSGSSRTPPPDDDPDVVPPELRNDPALRDVTFGVLPPSVQSQLGKLRASFKPSTANVLAGVIFGIIFIVFGLILAVWLIAQAVQAKFSLPIMAEHGMSWVVLIVAESLSWGLAIVGVVVILRLRKTSGDLVFVGTGGLCLVRKATYDVLPWAGVAEVQEWVIQEHAPIKRVGSLIPTGKDHMYNLRLKDGREFLFNSTNIRHLRLFRAILERAASLNRIPWSVQHGEAPHLA